MMLKKMRMKTIDKDSDEHIEHLKHQDFKNKKHSKNCKCGYCWMKKRRGN